MYNLLRPASGCNDATNGVSVMYLLVHVTKALPVLGYAIGQIVYLELDQSDLNNVEGVRTEHLTREQLIQLLRHRGHYEILEHSPDLSPSLAERVLSRLVRHFSKAWSEPRPLLQRKRKKQEA